MVDRWTVGLAGTGSIGRRHIGSLQQILPHSKFVFLRDGARTDALSDDLSAQVVGAVDALLATQPDMVIIATPSALHFPLLEAVIDANVPVYIEKPIVTTRNHVELIRHTLDGGGYNAPSLVGCNLRFLPSLTAMRDIITEGQIGRPVRASFEAGQWLPSWRPGTDYRQNYSANPNLGGGVAWDLIHEMDAAHWMFGQLHLHGAQIKQVPELDIKAGGVMSAVLENATDTLITLSVDYVARQPVRRYSVIGTGGTVVWDLTKRQVSLATADQALTPVTLPDEAFDTAATYPRAMSSLVRAIAMGGQTVNPIASGLESCNMILNILDRV